MDTNELRRLVATAAEESLNGRLWPNGLGFDRMGVSYTFNEQEGLWMARTAQGRLGSGPDPLEALRDARRQPRPKP